MAGSYYKADLFATDIEILDAECRWFENWLRFFVGTFLDLPSPRRLTNPCNFAGSSAQGAAFCGWILWRTGPPSLSRQGVIWVRFFGTRVNIGMVGSFIWPAETGRLTESHQMVTA